MPTHFITRSIAAYQNRLKNSFRKFQAQAKYFDTVEETDPKYDQAYQDTQEAWTDMVRDHVELAERTSDKFADDFLNSLIPADRK